MDTSNGSKVFIRTPYNYSMDQVSQETGLSCPEESLTSQEFAEEVDINTIARNFGMTGQLPENIRLPQYGDFTGSTDYHTMCNEIAQAGESFDMLPADIRYRFQNDPAQFVDFCLDEKNKAELHKMGLLREDYVTSSPAPIGDPPATPAPSPSPVPADPNPTATP